MDAWLFPGGTYSFKRFEVDGKLVETRMIHKYGPASDEVLYATYVWDQESQLSHLDDNGHVVPRDGGADYEVPSVATNRPDEAGLNVIEAFIESLGPAN